MNVDKKTIRELYEAGEGTFKKLSEKYEVSQGTIKSWAKQDRDNNDPWIKPTKPKFKPKTKNQNEKVEDKVEVEKSEVDNNNSDKNIDETTTDKEVGAKGKYHEWLTGEGLIKIEGWARDGLTDEQIAYNIGISARTLYEWKNKYPQISQSLKRGKEVIDRQVENALLRKALGYSYTETKIEESGMGSKETRTIKEVAPDTTAQIFWLKNRKPDTWRDRPKADDKDVLSKLDKLIEEIGDEAKS